MINIPELIDNQNGNSLIRSLRKLLGAFGEQPKSVSANTPDLVRIATAYLNPAGFALIADQLQNIPEVRLLLGTDPAIIPSAERKKLDETLSAFENRQMVAGLICMENMLHEERDRLPFTQKSTLSLRKMIRVLNAENIKVRRYEKKFLHAKAYIVTPSNSHSDKPDGLIVGSSNLTGAGLTRNLELNLGRYERYIAEQGANWFDDLWDDAVPYDLASIFEKLLVPYTPWEIFIRVLWHLYGSEVEDDINTDDNLPLTSFQKHGVVRALRLIQEIGGVIVADEVGLGKTFIAGEILQHYRERRQRALLICPASLRDTTWRQFLNTYQLFVECVSFEQFAKNIQSFDSNQVDMGQKHLQRPPEEYQLVIIDEAHNYRNPDAPSRAGVLRRFLFGHKRDLLLLTATPVNNSLWDLYHLIRFFLRQDTSLADQGILSIRERFDRAMREDPTSLSPDILYPIIDATTVKRTRQFVKQHYSNDTIKGPDGNSVPIVFPKPNAISVRYNLDDLLPGFFEKLEQALDPDSDNKIEFARYMPNSYLLDRNTEESHRARAFVGLLRSGILKRFESSIYAFRCTIQKITKEHEVFVKTLDAGYVIGTDLLKEISADDESAFDDILATSDHKEDVLRYDVEALRRNVLRDHAILQDLLSETTKVTVDQDPKLKALAHVLNEIVEQSEDEAISAEDAKQKRKVIVYSYFEDTVRWIRDYLMSARELGIGCYHDRTVVVSGSNSLSDVCRDIAVQGFAPISMEAPAPSSDRYDLLISTDVLAEGVNLQQCRHIINFDLPWNPMRLIQRHGRIDRIGSSHDQVFLRTIFPTDQIDRLLNLEERILNKLAMAAASIGVEAPVEGAGHGRQVFADTREEIEKLFDEDASLFERGGVVSATQSGEEYRQTLRKALNKDRERIMNMPWKARSAMIGRRRGVLFCAVVGRDSKFERTYLRFVAADDSWDPIIERKAIEREVGTCLRLIECTSDTPTWQSAPLEERVYDFWRIAQEDILNDWSWETDPANLQPAVRRLNHRVAEFIRKHPPADVSKEKFDQALDILESPWPRREEFLLRKWFEADDQQGSARSRKLISEILNTGLEPNHPPEPLPSIEVDDIELSCWMGIEKSLH